MKRNKVMRAGHGKQNVQTIACIELEEADRNVSPGNPPTGCIWLKSKKPLPRIITTTSLTSTNAALKADYVEWGQYRHKLYSRSFKPYMRYYTFLDSGDGSFLYIYNDEFLSQVSMSGVFENPNHAAIFYCGEENQKQKFLRCSPFDTPLYMDRDMTDVIYKMTFDFLARTTQGSTIDVKSDNIDNATGIHNTTA